MYHFFFCGRDGKVPVSFIQKYLMKKLDLTNESEVSVNLSVNSGKSVIEN